MARQKKSELNSPARQRFREAAELALELLSDRTLNLFAWRIEDLIQAVRSASRSYDELPAHDRRLTRRITRRAPVSRVRN